MRAYLILTLKWAITLVLSYCIYREGHIYTAIALVWVMGWIEAYMGLLGTILIAQAAQSEVINVLATERITNDVDAINAIIDRMQDENIDP